MPFETEEISPTSVSPNVVNNAMQEPLPIPTTAIPTTFTPGQVIRNSITGIASGVTSTVIDFIAPGKRKITLVMGSGNVLKQQWTIEVNNVVVFETTTAPGKSSFSQPFNPALEINTGDTLKVRITHFENNILGKFAASVVILQ